MANPSPSRKGVSLQSKLSGAILLTVAPLIALVVGNLTTRQFAMQRASLSGKALSFGRFLAHEAGPAVAFDDRQTARELFESLTLDSDLSAASILRANGEPLETRGQLSREPLRRDPSERALSLNEKVVRATFPVASVEGPVGSVVVELSLARIVQAQKAILGRSLLLGGVALFLGGLAAFLIGRALGRRIGTVEKAATAVAQGDLDQPALMVQGRDEIARLGTAFNAMLATIRQSVATIRETAQSEAQRLEAMVDKRTAQLNERNLAMRALLDNVDQGFLTILRDGTVLPERSAIVASWLPFIDQVATFADALGRLDQKTGDLFRLGWSMVEEDELPIEVALDQLPKLVVSEGRHLSIAFRPVGQAVLCVMTDVSAALRREREERLESQRLKLFSQVMKSRPVMVSFLGETDRLMEQVAHRDRQTDHPPGEGFGLAQALHTLKGTFAIHDLGGMAKLCHDIEDVLVETGALPPADLQSLELQWRELRGSLTTWMGDGPRHVELSEADHQAFLKDLEDGVAHASLWARARQWTWEPTLCRLQLLADGATALAARLGKSGVVVSCRDGGVRVPQGSLDGVWGALIHVLRNALDHGGESAEQRTAQGKPPALHVDLVTSWIAGALHIEVSDDGSGVSWERVAAKAAGLGMPTVTRADLVNALFSPTFSTRDEVTETSGRGVGLGALQEVVLGLGGRVDIDSQVHQGTTVRCIIPARSSALPPEQWPDSGKVSPPATARDLSARQVSGQVSD